jgi:hypothetical protein
MQMRLEDALVANATNDFCPPESCWIRNPSSDLELNDTYEGEKSSAMVPFGKRLENYLYGDTGVLTYQSGLLIAVVFTVVFITLFLHESHLSQQTLMV